MRCPVLQWNCNRIGPGSGSTRQLDSTSNSKPNCDSILSDTANLEPSPPWLPSAWDWSLPFLALRCPSYWPRSQCVSPLPGRGPIVLYRRRAMQQLMMNDACCAPGAYPPTLLCLACKHSWTCLIKGQPHDHACHGCLLKPLPTAVQGYT